MLPVIPPDVIRLGYPTLCDVQLLHRYFLNVGTTPFEQDPPDVSVLAARRDYDMRRFWRLEASPATAALLRRRQLLLQFTAEGLRLAGTLPAPATGSPGTVALTFWAYPTDPAWVLYTQLPPEANGQDKLNLLLPTATNPAGRVLALTAPATPPSPLPADGIEPLTLALENWSDAGTRPVAVLRLLLTEGAAPRHFSYVLGNRYTYWEYQQQRRSTPLPLVRYGRIDAGFGDSVPNPTPATTIPDGNIYRSIIY